MKRHATLSHESTGLNPQYEATPRFESLEYGLETRKMIYHQFDDLRRQFYDFDLPSVLKGPDTKFAKTIIERLLGKEPSVVFREVHSHRIF